MPFDVLKPPKNVSYLQKCEHKHPTGLRANPGANPLKGSKNNYFNYYQFYLSIYQYYLQIPGAKLASGIHVIYG